MQSPYLFSMIHNVFYEIEYQTRLAQVQCFLMHSETEIIIIIILRLTAVECQLIKGMEITHCDYSSRISWIYFLYEEPMYRINSEVNKQDWKKLLISIEMNKYRMLNSSGLTFLQKMVLIKMWISIHDAHSTNVFIILIASNTRPKHISAWISYNLCLNRFILPKTLTSFWHLPNWLHSYISLTPSGNALLDVDSSVLFLYG